MAATVVQVVKTVNNTGTSPVTTSNITGVASGNMLVLIVLEYCALGAGSHLAALTSAKLDNTTQGAIDPSFEAQDAANESMRVSFFSWPNVASGTHSFTCVFPAAPALPTNLLFFAVEVSGAVTTTAIDGAGAGASGNSTTAASGAASSTNSDDLWLVATTSLAANPATYSALGGFSIPTNGSETDSSTNLCGAVAFLSNPGATSENGQFTVKTGAWQCVIAAYKSAAGAAAAPFIPSDTSNPAALKYAVANRTHINTLSLELRQKDQFFTTPGRGPTYDWPNPRGYIFPQEDRSFVDGSETWLWGKDKFFRGAGQAPNYDYPNPLIAKRPRADADTTNLLSTLLKVVAAQAPFSQTDWPNPLRPIIPVDLKTFLSWFMVDDSMPFQAGATTQNPLIARRAVETWLQNLLESTLGGTPPPPQSPFYQLDWPNPSGVKIPIDLRTFLNQVELTLLGQDQFFTSPGRGPSFDWPNPTRGVFNSPELRTFVSGTKLNLLNQDQFFTSPGEGPTYDYPNPNRPPFSERGFLGSTNFNLGQDTFFGGPGQPPANQDFPNPLRPARSTDALSWLYDLANTTLSVVILPFRQSDWPFPPGYRFATDLRTFINDTDLNLIGQDTFYGGPGQPLVNIQWPVPRGYVGVIDLKTQTLNLLQSTLAPPPAPPSTAADIILVDGRLAKHLSGILYIFLD